MAPAFGTGIGMTENAGFATFTPEGISIEEMAGQVGRCFPDLALVTVRKPMDKDGRAGKSFQTVRSAKSAIIPYRVLGYYNMPEETAKTISTEGILYTGDLGYFKDMGTYRALYLAGRRKFVVKQKGYNVFPDEVESHLAGLEEWMWQRWSACPTGRSMKAFSPLYDRKKGLRSRRTWSWSTPRKSPPTNARSM